MAALRERLPQRRGVIDVRIADVPAAPTGSDRAYVLLVRAGAAFSLASSLALGLRLRRAAQRERTAEAAIPS